MVRDNYTRVCKLERCIDGDTVELWVDLGLRVWSKQTFRLLAIDTPERGDEPAFTIAKEGLARLIKKHSNKDGLFHIITTKKRSFSRWIATLFSVDGQTCINDLMVEEGYAKPYARNNL